MDRAKLTHERYVTDILGYAVANKNPRRLNPWRYVLRALEELQRTPPKGRVIHAPRRWL